MRRWRVLTIGETDVYVHPSILICTLYACLTGHLLFLLLATVSIIIHEASHAVTSALLGQKPASIEITPLGAAMHLEDDARLSAQKQFLTLVSGPLATCALCYASIWAAHTEILSLNLGRMLFLCNLSILILNLLPVLPLDGGRLLALGLRLVLPQHLVGKIMRCIGTCVGVGLILVNIAVSWKIGGWNLSLAFTGCCIIYSAAICSGTQAMAELRYFMDRKITLERKQVCPTQWYTCIHTSTLRHMIRMLPPGKIAMFSCVEAGSLKKLGILTEQDVIQCFLDNPAMTLEEALNRTAKY